MNRIQVGKENSSTIDLYYEDHGSGRPVVLIHGWPLSAASWEKQVPALLDAGYRVVTYDRRGFGRSSQPATGYDYDTMSDDLQHILNKLELRDVTLVGFSMGGGEVARYLGAHGAGRVRQAVFMAAIPPFLLKGPDNPVAADATVFEGIQKGLVADRPAFLSGFLADFFNVDVLRGKRISDEAVRVAWSLGVSASPVATIACVRAWLTDFRPDLARIEVPTLVVHGDDDRIVPLGISGQRTHEAIRGSRLVTIHGGPHGINWTHADEVNRALLAFLAEGD